LPATTTTTTVCEAIANDPDIVNIDFSLADHTVNNLGGLGPDTTPFQELYYKGVAQVKLTGQTVDLRITVDSGSYDTNRPDLNGVNTYYGVVSVSSGTSVDLKFNFVDPETGEPAALKKFFFSWFDLDEGKDEKSKETVTLTSGFSEYFLVPGSEVVEDQGPSFTSSTYGEGVDNPRDPMNLTPQQASRTFAVMYEDTSEFKVRLTVGAGFASRNFLFTGMSQLVLASVPECCPPHICPVGRSAPWTLAQ